MDIRLKSLFPPPVLHPGVVLRQEYLVRLGIPQGDLAKAIGVERSNLCTIIHERRRITLQLGRLLAGALGTLPEYWLLRQLAWDLEHAEPLRPVARLPQLSDPRVNCTWAAGGLYLDLRPGMAKRRSLREASGWKMAQDRRF